MQINLRLASGKESTISIAILLAKKFMFFIMFSATHYLEVFNPIVLAIFILMVNNLSEQKFSIQMFFHNCTMFKYIGIVNSNANISSAMAYSLVLFFKNSLVSNISTMIRTIFNAFSYSIRPCFKFLFTYFAYERDFIRHSKIVSYRHGLFN